MDSNVSITGWKYYELLYCFQRMLKICSRTHTLRPLHQHPKALFFFPLTYFMLLVSFYTPWKHQKTSIYFYCYFFLFFLPPCESWEIHLFSRIKWSRNSSIPWWLHIKNCIFTFTWPIASKIDMAANWPKKIQPII